MLIKKEMEDEEKRMMIKRKGREGGKQGKILHPS